MTIIFLILVIILPEIIWFLFYFAGRTHKEPLLWLILTFVGGFLAAFISFAIEYPTESVLISIKILKYSPIYFLVFAIVEETTKFAVTYLATSRNKWFKAPIDAMIYMVVTSLGFAALENLGAVFTIKIEPIFENNFFSAVLIIMLLRFIGATLLHSLSSAIVGYYWAMDIIHFFQRRYLIFGLILASFVHALFNVLIYQFGPISYTILFLVILGFWVFGDFEKLRQINI